MRPERHEAIGKEGNTALPQEGKDLSLWLLISADTTMLKGWGECWTLLFSPNSELQALLSLVPVMGWGLISRHISPSQFLLQA